MTGTSPFAGRSPRLACGLIWLGYVGALLLLASHHEMWRDEVRAWSIARSGSGFGDVLAVLRNEGHPALWYALLRLGDAVFDTPLVLPGLGLAIAAATAGVWLVAAPFGLGTKALFLAGCLPLFEYGVMSRNYGIGGLLLFLVAFQHESRDRAPLRTGSLLALLANTNAPAAVVAGGLLLVWLVDGARSTGEPRDARARIAFLTGIGLAVAGLLLFLWTVGRPDSGNIVLAKARPDGSAALRALVQQAVNPGRPFTEFVPMPLRPLGGAAGVALTDTLTGACLVLFTLRLLPLPNLAMAHVAIVLVMGTFFRVVYPGQLRHVGMLFFAVVSLEWMARRAERGAASGLAVWSRRTWRHCLLALLVLHAARGAVLSYREVREERSSARALGRYIRAQPAFSAAVLVGVPDESLEPLAYYLRNPTFSAREGRYVQWFTLARTSRDTMGLRQYLAVADSVAGTVHAPVLLVVGFPTIASDSVGSFRLAWGRHFSWTAGEWREFAERSRFLARFDQAIEENYALFELRPPSLTLLAAPAAVR